MESKYLNVDDLVKDLKETKGLYTIVTGERGAFAFHMELERLRPVIINKHSLVFQVNDCVFNLLINPLADNRDIGSKEHHPNGGFSKSYTYYIIEYGE